jgi:hypothetical protein
MNLAERLNELARRKAEEEEDAMENDFNTPYEVQQPDWRHRNPPRSIPKKSARPSANQQRDDDEEEMEADDVYEDEDSESMTMSGKLTQGSYGFWKVLEIDN